MQVEGPLTTQLLYNRGMYHVYILRSIERKDKLYIGYTTDMNQRLKMHNEGRSTYTARYAPWHLIYVESFRSKLDAQKRERRLKVFDNNWKQLFKRIKESLNEG